MSTDRSARLHAASLDQSKTWDAVWTETRTTFSLALPIAVTQVAQMAMNTTDVLMTGWLGPLPLAAGQLGGMWLFPFIIAMMGILFATAAMFAQELGARRYKGVRRTFRQGLWVIAAMTVPAWLVLSQSRPILLWLGQDPAAVDGAMEYLSAAMLGLPFMVAFGLLRNFISAHSRPKPAMYILGVAFLINALANYALIFGHFGLPRLELFGLGLATAIVQVTMFGILFIYVLRDRKYRRYLLLANLWKPDWPRFREIWGVGAPIAGAKTAESGLFAASGLLIGSIGVNQLAGHAIAIQFVALAFMIPFGISQAATIRVGFNIGRGDPDTAKLAGRVSFALGAAVMLPSMIGYAVFGRPLAELFLNSGGIGEEVVIGYAAAYLTVGALFQLADGGQAVAAGALRGLKDTQIPMWIAIAGYWGIGLVAAWVLAFPLGLDGVGVWLGLASGLFVVWIALVWRFERLMRDRFC